MKKDAKIDAEVAARELTLVLLFLNRFRNKLDKDMWTPWRVWKNHNFGTLDELDEKGFIFSRPGAKSIYFTDEGVAEACRLLEKYGIADWPNLKKENAQT